MAAEHPTPPNPVDHDLPRQAPGYEIHWGKEPKMTIISLTLKDAETARQRLDQMVEMEVANAVKNIADPEIREQEASLMRADLQRHYLGQPS